MFTYDSKRLLDAYSFTPSPDPAFVPAFSLSETSDDLLVADMLTMCIGEGAQFCKYDTLTTQSLEVGNATQGPPQLSGLDGRPAASGVVWLAPTTQESKEDGTRYLEGNTLSFSCNEGHILYGSTQRTCLDDGTWTGEQPYCIKETKKRNQSRWRPKSRFDKPQSM
ncbi:sushi domain-containing protein 2 [Paralichthys olivaceus]|uniref:sushi domain-containing protein 2 n=1 Tax=Paralichthys olivaceus TaxID=8255 RepID=UPI003752CCC6